MDFIHYRNSNILFSLCGSRVNEIKFHNKTLTLKVGEMYEFVEVKKKHTQVKYVLKIAMWNGVEY